MTPQLFTILAEIATLGRVEATTREQRTITDYLFDLGYLTIAPPGWCYIVSDAGKTALALEAAKAQRAA